jgi:hypothetical protein
MRSRPPTIAPLCGNAGENGTPSRRPPRLLPRREVLPRDIHGDRMLIQRLPPDGSNNLTMPALAPGLELRATSERVDVVEFPGFSGQTLASRFWRRSDAEVQAPDPGKSSLGLRIYQGASRPVQRAFLRVLSSTTRSARRASIGFPTTIESPRRRFSVVCITSIVSSQTRREQLVRRYLRTTGDRSLRESPRRPDRPPQHPQSPATSAPSPPVRSHPGARASRQPIGGIQTSARRRRILQLSR